jgi:hypothetical protein
VLAIILINRDRVTCNEVSETIALTVLALISGGMMSRDGAVVEE